MAYYGKLPIVLLSELAAGREDSYTCRIAAYLLDHLGQTITAEETARDCFVSKSAVSRFCRDVGLEDFTELKDLLRTAEKPFEPLGKELPAPEQGALCASLAAESMELAARTLDYTALAGLTADLRRARRVACFGLLKAEAAALSLQSDLVMLGKPAVTKVSFREQTEYLASAGEDELILIFSYRGVYFTYDLPREAMGKRPGLWVVTGSADAEQRLAKAGIGAKLLRFSSRQDLASHPYQLLAVAGIIAQRFGAEADAVRRV